VDYSESARTLIADTTTRERGTALGIVRCADPADADDRAAVSELREVAYRHAVEFAIHADTYVGWCPLDDRSAVATAWSDGELVSTLRATAAGNAEVAADILTCSVDLPPDAFPAVVLTKAATRSGRRAGGLHSVLRYHCLGAAARQGLRSALGLVYADAPRVRTMVELGYELRRPERVWDPEGPAITTPLFAVLPRHRMDSAIARLATAFADAFIDYPWSGAPLRLPRGHLVA
jgi:hypothetical protein